VPDTLRKRPVSIAPASNGVAAAGRVCADADEELASRLRDVPVDAASRVTLLRFAVPLVATLRFVAPGLRLLAATFFAGGLVFFAVAPLAAVRRRLAAETVPASRSAARIADVQDFSARAPVRRRGMGHPSGDGRVAIAAPA
jgi:hypothetical protein